MGELFGEKSRVKLEIALVVIILGLSTWVKFVSLGDRAFVFDEVTHVRTAKHFVTAGFDWQAERSYGSAQMPMQYYLMGWTWLLADKVAPGLPEEFVFRVPSVIMSSLAILVVYLIARRFSFLLALLATLLFAFHPFVLAYSRFASLDLPVVFWSALGVLLYMHYLDRAVAPHRSFIWLILAGIVFGISGVSKDYSLFILPATIVHLLIWHRQERSNFRISLLHAGFLLLSSLVTIVGLSFAFSGDPLLLYKDFTAIWATAYTLPNQVVGTLNAGLIDKIVRLANGMRGVLYTLWSHLGNVVFLVSLAGAILVTTFEESRGRRVLSLYFVLIIAFGALLFSPYHFPRYLLTIVASISIFFAFGVIWCSVEATQLLRKHISVKQSPFVITAPVIILLLALAAWAPVKIAGRLYSAWIIDDWTYADTLKVAARYVADRVKPGEWVLSTGNYHGLTYYGGFDSALYMGFNPGLQRYEMYNRETRRPLTSSVTSEQERLLRFVVVEDSGIYLQSVLFDETLARQYARRTYSPEDAPLKSYLSAYFREEKAFGNQREVRVYERTSRNYYYLLPQPELWVGEGGAVWKQNLANYNGWIMGEGWGQPRAVSNSGETYWARPALRDGNRFADFMLPIRDTGQPVTLEILFQDIGTGQTTVATLLREARAGEQERFLRPLGQIQLTNSGALKTATFALPSVWYIDASPDVAGHQQHFSFFTQGSAIQVIKVRIVQ